MHCSWALTPPQACQRRILVEAHKIIVEMRLKGDIEGEVKKDNVSSKVRLNKKPGVRVHFVQGSPRARPDVTILESRPQYTAIGAIALRQSLDSIPFRVQQ